MNSLIELAAIILALASPVTVALCYGSLPARVPIHFGFKGEPDGWGARPMIWLLPVIGLIIYAMMTVLPLLDPKAGQVGRMVQLMKLEILAMFLFILRGQIRVALGQAQRLGPAIWLFLVIVMATSFSMSAIAPMK